MNPNVRQLLDQIHSADRQTQGAAYQALLQAAAQPVDWSYEAWDEIVASLASPDNRLRSIAAQLLCRLAAHSDPKNRILRDFEALLAVTRDEKFVTARHAIEALWQVGTAGRKQAKLLTGALARRYADCVEEKNATLVRYDIVVCLRRLYEATKDEDVREVALALVAAEADPKYRRKYSAVWR